ncbi:tyrosine-type recombinase/integrase [Desulfatitalea tepidiphila]|uniref:tyrosine-type recombinase/integrase n=1 Tax=Desulfatitalea tepidiphila TaxID=1185843 RepID=UPI000977254B|nr:site-specific integrase [Desulfatitalea tepidiphila]
MAILQECPACKRKQSVKKKRCVSCGLELDELKKSRLVKYWIDFRYRDPKTGKTVQRRESVEAMEGLQGNSIADARTALAKRSVQKAENRVLDILPEHKLTFSELADWYLALESVKTLKSYKTVKGYINKFKEAYGQRIVADILPADLEDLQAKRLGQNLKLKTIDDEINYVKTMVIKGFDNGKVGGDALRSFRRVKKLLKGHANARDRYLTIDEFARLLEASPNHLKNILTIGYWSGMRKGEITALTWDKIDMKGRMIRLEAEDTKEGKAKSIPMAEAVYRVIQSIPRSIHDPHVFLYYSKPITRNFSQGLKSACKNAGIAWGRDVKGGFIFHDLRHTFVTDMRRAGVDRTVRMAITGHAIHDMDQRYDVVEESDKLEAIRRLEKYRSKVACLTNVDQTLTKSGF